MFVWHQMDFCENINMHVFCSSLLCYLDRLRACIPTCSYHIIHCGTVAEGNCLSQAALSGGWTVTVHTCTVCRQTGQRLVPFVTLDWSRWDIKHSKLLPWKDTSCTRLLCFLLWLAHMKDMYMIQSSQCYEIIIRLQMCFWSKRKYA